jgi:S-formylglutathione hydrolase FrmB
MKTGSDVRLTMCPLQFVVAHIAKALLGSFAWRGRAASRPYRGVRSLVAGTLEPLFLENAARWADALRDAGADVVMNARPGSHGDAFWQEEFPLMVAWAFGQ